MDYPGPCLQFHGGKVYFINRVCQWTSNFETVIGLLVFFFYVSTIFFAMFIQKTLVYIKRPIAYTACQGVTVIG